MALKLPDEGLCRSAAHRDFQTNITQRFDSILHALLLTNDENIYLEIQKLKTTLFPILRS